VNVERFSGLRMHERKMGRVEEVTVDLQLRHKVRNDLRSTIKCVTDDGVTKGLGMDSDLVCAAGLDADLDEGKRTIRSRETFENMKV
jgi:hypothetical protein